MDFAILEPGNNYCTKQNDLFDGLKRLVFIDKKGLKQAEEKNKRHLGQ